MSRVLLAVYFSRCLLVSAEEAYETSFEGTSFAQPQPQLQVGERLSFHGRWFGIPVGSGWIEVKERVILNGRRAYHIEAQGRSNKFLSRFCPIRDRLHSYLDAETLQPLRFEKYQREGHYRSEELVTFDYGRLIAHHWSLLSHVTKEIPIPPDIHDIVSTFYWLRMHPLGRVPQSILLNIYSDEKVYRTEVRYLELTSLELLRRGTFLCLLVEPLATFKGILVRRGRLRMYVSLDSSRTPLFVTLSTPWGPMTAVLDPESFPSSLNVRSRPQGNG